MEHLNYYLFSKLTNNLNSYDNIYLDILLLCVIIPIFKYLLSDLHYTISNFKKKFFNNYNVTIDFTGWERLESGYFSFDFPRPMMAICYYIYNNKFTSKLRYYNPSKNGKDSYNDYNDSYDYNYEIISYILNNTSELKIDNDLYIDFKYNKFDGDDKKNVTIWEAMLIIKSKNRNIDDINKFIRDRVIEYEQYTNKQTDNKLYNFIYSGNDNDGRGTSLNFTYSILSDNNNPNNKCYETFDHIFSSNKEILINDLKRLNDVNYYKKTGNKHKKGYILYGPPGCGKTTSVKAMALEDNRHIIEVSLAKIKTDEELEELFNIDKIDNIKFSKKNIIILFDEIDRDNDVIQKDKDYYDSDDSDSFDEIDLSNLNINNDNDNDNDNDSDTNKNKDKDKDNNIIKKKNKRRRKKNSVIEIKSSSDHKKIKLSSILSRFDGISSYNGLIIVATTNNLDKIDPAIYRNGRLNPIKFNFISKNECIEMIEKYFEIKLDDKQLLKIPDTHNKIPHSTVKVLIERYENNLDIFLNILYKYNSIEYIEKKYNCKLSEKDINLIYSNDEYDKLINELKNVNNINDYLKNN